MAEKGTGEPASSPEGAFWILWEDLKDRIREATAKALGRASATDVEELKEGDTIWMPPTTARQQAEDESKKTAYFVPYGWYTLSRACDKKMQLIPLAKKGTDGTVFEFGASKGKITSAHLRSIYLFEAICDRAGSETKRIAIAPGDAVAGASFKKLRSSLWGEIFKYLVPKTTFGAFSFAFDTSLVSLLCSCRSLYQTVSMHPVWILTVLGLEPKHLGAVLSCEAGVTCSGMARYISFNAERLPDVIRNDEKFRDILRPYTRHQIAEKQALACIPKQEDPSPKLRAVQLLSTFLMGEPAYRGDADADPVTAELFAVCEKVAKTDPLFVLKLAYYTRHTLTFRNTTNFLLASAVKIEPCRPYIRLALPKCTNLPTDLLELWDFWRKLSGAINLPACLKKGFALKFSEFGDYQLGKYLNARVPKPQQVAVMPQAKAKGKGKGRGRGGGAGDEAFAAAKAEAMAKLRDPKTRPLTLKALIRTVHAGKQNPESVCGVLRKRYPDTEEEFQEMLLDQGGKTFQPEKSGEKMRIPIPKTWETQLSERGNTPEVWEDLVKSRSLPFMAMLKNLRNIILAGVTENTHKEIVRRLKSPKDIANSKQMPVKFLSAFEAIDFDQETLDKLEEEKASGKEFVEEEKNYGTGKEAKKVIRKRRVCQNPPTKKLLDRYRDALEKAVSLAAAKNVPEFKLPSDDGKVVVMIDVSGSMNAPLTTGPKKLHPSALVPHRRSNGRPIVEGQDMDLEDYFSQFGQRTSRKMSVSMTWIGQDLDLSVAVFDKAGTNLQNISYSNLEWHGIKHSGDITSAPNGAEEVLSVDLDQLPPEAFFLAFTVNVFSGQQLNELEEAAIALRDDGLEGYSNEATQEICAFRLTGGSKAVVACALVKKDKGWGFRCLNTTQDEGMTVQSLLATIKKDFDATLADAATTQKRLCDAAMMLGLCLRERLGPERVELCLFGAPTKDGKEGYKVPKALGPKVLQNMRRCAAEANTIGPGTEFPVQYLQEKLAAKEPIDMLVLLSDGLVSPTKDPEHALGRWLRTYRNMVRPVKYINIDLLGLGAPSLTSGGSPDDVLVAGYSEAALKYLASEPDAQLKDVEAIELPLPSEKGEEGEKKDKEGEKKD